VTEEAFIGVEWSPTNPPRPIGFCIVAAGKTIAVLTHDQVNKAMTHWDIMQFAQSVSASCTVSESK
jgi:hypothetical protein